MNKLLAHILFVTGILFNTSAHAFNKEDSLAVGKLLGQSRQLFSTNPDSSNYFSKKAISLAKESGFHFGLANAYYATGVNYRQTGNEDMAIHYYDSALRITQQFNIPDLQSSVLSNLGVLFQERAEYTKALNYDLKALAIRQSSNDKKGIAKVLHNIAIVFQQEGNNSKAVDYFAQAINTKLEYGDSASAANSYNALSISYLNEKKFDLALEALNKAYAINLRNESDEDCGINLGNFALVYDQTGDKIKAADFYKRSIDLLTKTDPEDLFLAGILNNAGSLELERHDISSAITHFQRALSIAIKNQSLEDERDAYGNLANAYSQKKDFESAFINNQKFSALSDSLSSIKSNQQLAEMMVKFQTEQKERENKILNAKVEIQQLKLKNNQFIIWGMIALLLMLAFSGFLLFRQRKLRNDQERIMLERRLLQSQLNPHFIFNCLQSIQSFILTHKAEEGATYLSDFARLMRMMLEQSREEYTTIHDQFALLECYMQLQQLRFEQRFEYKIDVDPSLQINTALIPSMLLQPFVENAIEHGFKNIAYKGFLTISARREGTNYLLCIEDNGKGRSKAAGSSYPEKQHQSLSTMITEERIRIYNKQNRNEMILKITDLLDDQKSPCGTKVTFVVPE